MEGCRRGRSFTGSRRGCALCLQTGQAFPTAFRRAAGRSGERAWETPPPPQFWKNSPPSPNLRPGKLFGTGRLWNSTISRLFPSANQTAQRRTKPSSRQNAAAERRLRRTCTGADGPEGQRTSLAGRGGPAAFGFRRTEDRRTGTSSLPGHTPCSRILRCSTRDASSCWIPSFGPTRQRRTTPQRLPIRSSSGRTRLC